MEKVKVQSPVQSSVQSEVQSPDNDALKSEGDELLNKSTLYYNNLKMAQSYTFAEFDLIKDMDKCRNFSMCVCSKRRTGKSVLVKDICQRIHKWYHKAFVFSGTARLQPDLFSFVPKENIFDGFDEVKMQQIWDNQEKLVLDMRRSNTPEDDIPLILLIFDDIIDRPEVRRSQIFNRMAISARHIKMAFIVISQTFTGINPVLRTNLDYAISFYLDSCDNIASYAKSYLSTKNARLGQMILENVTKKEYQAIVCMNNITSSNPEETVRTFTARLKVPKFNIDKKFTKMPYLIDSFGKVSSNYNNTAYKLVTQTANKTIRMN